MAERLAQLYQHENIGQSVVLACWLTATKCLHQATASSYAAIILIKASLLAANASAALICSSFKEG